MRIVITALACFILSGCATTWHNDKFPSEASKQVQLKKDSGYCRAVSYGAVPMPPTRVYVPQQQNYNIQGTATGYNHQTGYTNYNYTGTVTPRSSPGASFSNGLAQGMAMGEILKADSERTEVFNACMMNLGWSDKPLPTTQVNATQKESQPTSSKQPQLLASSFPAALPTGPVMVSCGIFLDNKTPGKYRAQFNYIIDSKAKTVKSSSGTAHKVRSWREDEIITDDKGQTFDTTPPISIYNILVFNRVTGSFRMIGVWRTDQGKIVRGNDLAAIASKHPMWQYWPGGIWDRETMNGDCRVVQKKF